MAITISSAEIKRKAMIAESNTAYDSAISALITEMQGPLEYSISEICLNDTANVKLQATLKLGILEIITGEFIEQLRRQAGTTEQFSVAGVSVGEWTQRGIDLVQQGAARLAPYLKNTTPEQPDLDPQSSTSNANPIFSTDEGVW